MRPPFPPPFADGPSGTAGTERLTVGAATVVLAPVEDTVHLGGLIAPVRRIPGIVGVEVRSFDEGEAVLEVRAAHPVLLASELRRVLAGLVRSCTAAASGGRVVVDARAPVAAPTVVEPDEDDPVVDAEVVADDLLEDDDEDENPGAPGDRYYRHAAGRRSGSGAPSGGSAGRGPASGGASGGRGGGDPTGGPGRGARRPAGDGAGPDRDDGRRAGDDGTTTDRDDRRRADDDGTTTGRRARRRGGDDGATTDRHDRRRPDDDGGTTGRRAGRRGGDAGATTDRHDRRRSDARGTPGDGAAGGGAGSAAGRAAGAGPGPAAGGARGRTEEPSGGTDDDRDAEEDAVPPPRGPLDAEAVGAAMAGAIDDAHGLSVLVFDGDQRIRAVAGELPGERAALVGRPIGDAFAPGARRLVVPAVADALAGRSRTVGIPDEDGRVWLEVRCRPVGGGHPGGICLVRDLDAQGDAALLAEATRAFEITFRHSPIGQGLLSRSGRWLRVNGALSELVGRTADDLVGDEVADALHRADRDDERGRLRHLVEGDDDHYVVAARFLHADGHVVRTHTRMTRITDDEGTVRGFVAQVVDAAAWKRFSGR